MSNGDKHTSGPWAADGGLIFRSASNWAGPGRPPPSIAYTQIAEVIHAGRSWVDGHTPEDEANARLIAASPELLNAVRDLIHVVSLCRDPNTKLMTRDAIAFARKVIEKVQTP
jgi:hypothetical protein